jgi:multiple sugar transport system substrate-binding protein
MRRWKKFWTLSLMGLATIFCTACHGSVEKSAYVIPEEFDTQREYEITFWAKNDTNKAQTDIYQKAIDDFQKIYPNIKAVFCNTGNEYPDIVKFVNNLKIEVGGGEVTSR